MALTCPNCGNGRNFLVKTLQMHVVRLEDARVDVTEETPVIGPNGQVVQDARIIGYQATNTVNVKQRDLKQFGRVLDTLVAAGANQVNGPNFQVDNPEAALDEARTAAMKAARARADLYARAAGLRVVRILTISESGGYVPQPRVMYAKAEMAMDAAPTPIAAGQVELSSSVSVQFELAP